MAEFNEIRDKVGDAISQAVAGETEMVTRWAAIVEVVDAEGKRYAYGMAPDGATAWDTIGLLAYGIQLEQGDIVRDAIRGD